MHFISHACRIAAFTALASLSPCAQEARGTVTVTGRVSSVAAVSAGSAARVVKGDAKVSAEAAGTQGLVLSINGRRGGETEIEVPVRLRSNVALALTASYTKQGAKLSALSVVEVEGAGPFVYPGAADRVEVQPAFDGRAGARAPRSSGPELSFPATILTAPPISKGGTLDSPGNMIEVVLRIVLTPTDCEEGWHAELKISATRHAGAEQSPRTGASAGHWE